MEVLTTIKTCTNGDTHNHKDDVVESRGWEEEEEDGEEESSQEELVHVVGGGVDSLPQHIPLLASEESPQR